MLRLVVSQFEFFFLFGVNEGGGYVTDRCVWIPRQRFGNTRNADDSSSGEILGNGCFGVQHSYWNDIHMRGSSFFRMCLGCPRQEYQRGQRKPDYDA
jgi:hypothetical protein